MQILVKSAKIISTGSPFNRKIKDILIKNGKIEKIADKISSTKDYRVIDIKDCHISPGWFDMNACFFDPGFEHKEDIESGSKSAAFGGFTDVACLPNTNPPLQSKSEIEYVLNKSKGNIVNVHPIGAISKNLEGKEPTEMLDMNKTGAIAFSDGRATVNAGLMMRSLQYVKTFDGLVLSFPEEKSISGQGVMHEGITSTYLGLKGIPALAEELMIERDIRLAEYSDSKVHFANITTKKAIDMLAKAKKDKLKVTAGVGAQYIALDESQLVEYDTRFKVNPPLRTKEDIKAIKKAIKEGVIDVISSSHVPHDEESKKKEFDFADFGMINLETAFAVANTNLAKEISLEKMISALSNAPRKILNQKEIIIKEGERASLTLFNPKQKWTFEVTDIQSKSKNSPFIGNSFVGKALGIINNNKLFLS